MTAEADRITTLEAELLDQAAGRRWAQRLVGSLPLDVRAAFDDHMRRLDESYSRVMPPGSRLEGAQE